MALLSSPGKPRTRKRNRTDLPTCHRQITDRKKPGTCHLCDWKNPERIAERREEALVDHLQKEHGTQPVEPGDQDSKSADVAQLGAKVKKLKSN
jgi:hypothetical protein